MNRRKIFGRLPTIGPAAGLAVLAGLLVSACSDLQIDVPILNAAGIGLTSTTKPGEKKVKHNAPLVLPPKTAALPAPGSRAPAVASDLSWPDDPDIAKKQRAYAECMQAKKERSEGKWESNSKDGIEDFDKNQDSLARQPGLFESYKPNGKKDPCAALKNTAQN